MLFKSILVSYEAQDDVITRLERRGAIIGQCHCVKVGKIAKIFYYIPHEENKQTAGEEVDPWGDLLSDDVPVAYTIVYQTAQLDGPGIECYGNIMENAPSREAVLKMFAHLLDGPGSQVLECRATLLRDIYRRVHYINIDAL